MRRFVAAVPIFLFMSLLYCGNSMAFWKNLKTKEVKGKDIEGVYTLILYSSGSLERLAILDKEGDGYTFEVYAPDFDYKIKKNMPAAKAVKEAEEFVSRHQSFWRSQLSAIYDKSGNIIGYEVRPLFNQTDFGIADVLDVDYSIKKDRVSVKIRLNSTVEERFQGRGKLFGR